MHIGLGLSLTAQLRGGGTPFDMADLFSSGEVGGFFNPYNMDTMYQDAAASVPVTATGQPIGVISSEYNGLSFSADLTTNGDFSGGSTGWTTSGTTITGGEAIWSSDAIDTFILQGSVFESGKRYRVKLTVNSYGAGDLEVRFGGSTTDTRVFISGAGDYYVSGIATGTGLVILAFGNGTTISVGAVEVEEMLGSYLFQGSNAPIYRESGALRYFSCDTNQSFRTMTLTAGSDKMQFFAGVGKRSNSPTALLAEYSVNVGAYNGTFYVGAPSGGSSQDYGVLAKGTATAFTTSGVIAAPTTNVMSSLVDISGDSSILRVDGAQVDATVSDLGTGNFGDHVLYVGGRAGTSLFFTGDVYGLVLRFGSNLDVSNQVAPVESILQASAGLS